MNLQKTNEKKDGKASTRAASHSPALFAWVSLLLLLLVMPVHAATYFADFSAGNDASAGTSTGTAFKHCPGDVNATGTAAATTLAAGDTVIFKGGVSYVLAVSGSFDCIDLNWNGTAGSPITYDGNSAGTWGTGKAIITDNFANHGAEVWIPFYGGGNRTGLTFRNLAFQNIGGSASLPADPGSPVARNSAVCIFINGGATSCIVRDCSFAGIGYSFHQKPMDAASISGGGVTVLNCNSLTITNCSFTRMNIGCEMAANSLINNLTIANCTFTDSMRWPIDLLPNASGATIDNVYIHHNQFYDHWQFEEGNWTGYGESPHNDSIFMRIDTATCSWGSNVNVYDNQFWSTQPNLIGGTASIYITGGPSANIYNNTFRGTAQTRTIYVNGGTPGPTPQIVRIYENSFLEDYQWCIELARNVALLGTIDIRNNAFYSLRANANNQAFRIGNLTIANSLTVNYNRWYSLNQTGWFFWTGLASGGFAAMQSTGLEVNGSFGDPQFVNVVGVGVNILQNDLHLRSSSPCVSAGATLGAPYDIDLDGNTRTVPYSQGAYEFGTQTATQLGFSGQPTQTVAGSIIAPVVRVTAYDVANVPVGSYTGNITIAIGNNPGAGTLSGTLTVAAFGGIATFSNLSINNVANGYTLVATAAGLTSATSAAFNVTTLVPPTPSAPVLVAPVNGATGQLLTPTLTWNASANSTSYDVQVATDSGFVTVVASQTSLTATSYVPSPILLANTTYYWHVRGRNSGGTSAYSGTFSFSTALPAPGVPVLSSPADAATGVALNPTLSWGSVTFAANYRIQVATDAGFITVIADQTTTGTSFAPTLLAATTYYWHVRAQNATANSAYSTARSFTTSPPPAPAAPALSSPSNGAVDVSITPTMSWSASVAATSYHIQIATDAGFVTVIYDVAGLTGLSTVPTLVNSTVYYWHVLASNAGGDSAYSTARSFTTIAAVPAAPAAPTLASPADASTGISLNPTLTWNASTRATSYRIQIATDVGFGSVVSDQSVTSLSFAPALVQTTQYFWHVSASNTGGTSAYSTARSFTTLTTPPPPPPVPVQVILISPSSGATGQSVTPTLLWNSAYPATSYHLQVSTVINFASTVIDLTGLAGTNYVATLAVGITYYWRVLGNNTTGDGIYSSIFSFTTVPAVPAAPVLSSPSNGAVDQVLSPTLVWIASPGASSYGLQVATDAGFGALVVNLTGIAGVTYAPSLSAGTTYFWRANANNTGGTSGFSASRTFSTVPVVPAAPSLSSPSNGATGVAVSPSLTWATSPGATSYGLQVATDVGFGALVVDLDGLSGLTYVPALSSATTYYWHARAANTGGTSAYGATRSFTTVPVVPAVPSPAVPPNGAVNVPSTLLLAWNPSPGATSYRLQVSTSPIFASTVVDATGISGTSYYVTLANNTTYYWRVSASNAGGTSSFSAGISFSTQAVSPVSQSPVVNSKARLLMMIDRNGRMYKSNTAITNSADNLLANFSFYVPGDWLSNGVARSFP